jgi:hypothetical protein
MIHNDPANLRAARARFDAHRAARVEQTQLRHAEVQEQLASGITRLGYLVFDVTRRGELDHPRVRTMVDELESVRVQLASLNVELDQIQKEQFVRKPDCAYCLACGAENEAVAHFCRGCGRRLPDSPPAPADSRGVPVPAVTSNGSAPTATFLHVPQVPGSVSQPIEPLLGQTCPNCGEALYPDSSFCVGCGTRLARPSSGETSHPAATGRDPGTLERAEQHVTAPESQGATDLAPEPVTPADPVVYAATGLADTQPPVGDGGQVAPRSPQEPMPIDGVGKDDAAEKPSEYRVDGTGASVQPAAASAIGAAMVYASNNAHERASAFCEECGVPVEADALFCVGCGHRVISDEPAAGADAPEGSVVGQAGQVPAGLDESLAAAGAPARCGACGEPLEPDDAFCFACGHAREATRA